MITEGYDYELIAGKHLWPFGRMYRTLRPIQRPNGGIVEAGTEWNGANGLPMQPNSPVAYAFFCHDQGFGLHDMSMFATNNECIKLVKDESSIFKAIPLALVFHVVLLFTVMVFWVEAKSTAKHPWIYNVALYSVAFINFYVDYLFIQWVLLLCS